MKKPKLWNYKSGKKRRKLRPKAKAYLSYKLKAYWKKKLKYYYRISLVQMYYAKPTSKGTPTADIEVRAFIYMRRKPTAKKTKELNKRAKNLIKNYLNNSGIATSLKKGYFKMKITGLESERVDLTEKPKDYKLNVFYPQAYKV